MTRPALVLVTGSRDLAGHTDAAAWVRAHLDALAPAVVVTGDARGPDAWAAEWARDNDLVTICRTYRLSGAVCTANLMEPVGWWCGRSRPPHGDDGRALWAAWCLHRDRVMVQHVARRAADYAVTVLAARALWSKTNGTAFTIARAKAAGLDVMERAWTPRDEVTA